MNGAAPIVGAEVWHEVMERAGYRCQCTYKRHPAHRGDQGGRCERDATAAKLIAGPADPPARPGRSVTTPHADELVAWCPTCWDHAVALSRKHARQDQAWQAQAEPGLW